MSDVHYFIVFTLFFFLLGMVAPLVDSSLKQNQTSGLTPSDADVALDTIFGIPVGILQLIGNLFLIPFWTFGVPAWVSLWILLPLRLPYIFLIARNIWVGGGG
jgi:hypothetical protein